jgi:hypothetical protein
VSLGATPGTGQARFLPHTPQIERALPTSYWEISKPQKKRREHKAMGKIILSSGSVGATQQDIEKVLAANGYESETPEAEAGAAAVEAVEPKREDFDTDEAFETAQEEYEAAQDEGDEEEEEPAAKPATAAKPAAGEKRPLSRRQKAVLKATETLREDNRKLEERIKALETKSPGAVKKLEDLIAEAVAKVAKPKRADFDSDDKFGDAMADYGRKVAETERTARQQAERQVSHQSQLEKSFTEYQSSVAAFKEEHDDWDEVVTSSTAISEGVYLAVIRAKSPEVTYYLAKNPEVLTELNEMDAIGAAMEIGLLAKTLKKGDPAGAAKPKPKPRVIPEPIRPLSTAAANTTLTSKEAAEKRNYRAFKSAQRAGR